MGKEFIKSCNLFPELFWISNPIRIALSRKSVTLIKSFSVNPLVVNAGVPILIPPGVIAEELQLRHSEISRELERLFEKEEEEDLDQQDEDEIERLWGELDNIFKLKIN